MPVKAAGNFTRLACCAAAISAAAATAAYSQQAAIDDIKGKIFDARMAQQTFAEGLKHCNELDGKNVFQRLHNRILNLENYLHSLENLVKAEAFNPEKKRPWNAEDAKQRWEEVKREAQEDREKCELVRSLPQLEKQLDELQKHAAASDKKN
jgi:hypothetical protein